MGEFDSLSWFRIFGWSDNPFKIRPNPDNIVGFVDMRTRILTYMKSEDPFIVTGPTGAGKTTLLKWLEENKKDALYLNMLEDLEEKEVKRRIEGGFLEKLMRSFSGSKKIVLIDEAQEMSPKMTKWLRGKFDEGEIDSLILASIREDLENLEEPFADRIGGRVVNVRKLSEAEAFKMVKHRMYGAGNKNPFTNEGLRAVFEHSGFSPRKILENCEACCIHAAREGTECIDSDTVASALDISEKSRIRKKPTAMAVSPIIVELKDLSPGQQEILSILKSEHLDATQIAQKMKVSRASVAKQLSRLSFKTDRKLLQGKGFISPLVEAKNKGRPVLYGLTEEAKKLL